jgi:hypothetical protein
LREGEIFAAELDVVEREPEAETAPLGLENIRAGITVIPCQTIGAVPPGRHEYWLSLGIPAVAVEQDWPGYRSRTSKTT